MVAGLVPGFELVGEAGDELGLVAGYAQAAPERRTVEISKDALDGGYSLSRKGLAEGLRRERQVAGWA